MTYPDPTEILAHPGVMRKIRKEKRVKLAKKIANMTGALVLIVVVAFIIWLSMWVLVLAVPNGGVLYI